MTDGTVANYGIRLMNHGPDTPRAAFATVGGRPWLALRTPWLLFDCRGLWDPYDAVQASSQSGETSSFPDTGILHAAERSPLASWLISGWPMVPCGTASGEPASMTDEKPAPASAGLTDQVA